MCTIICNRQACTILASIENVTATTRIEPVSFWSQQSSTITTITAMDVTLCATSNCTCEQHKKIAMFLS